MAQKRDLMVVLIRLGYLKHDDVDRGPSAVFNITLLFCCSTSSTDTFVIPCGQFSPVETVK